MNKLDKLSRELESSGKKDALRSIADSADGRAIGRMFDAAEIENAVKSGDAAALQSILAGVLSTAEGKRLTEELKRAMK